MKCTQKILPDLLFAFTVNTPALLRAVSPAFTQVPRILPLGDSLTFGSHLRRYADGKPMGQPRPD